MVDDRQARLSVIGMVGAERIGASLASMNELLGLRITNPGTAVQHGSWVSQPVDILDSTGYIVSQLVDGKISYQMLVFDEP